MSTRFRTALALGALVAFASTVSAGEKKTIVETAVANGNFKTLVAAVKATGLAETLSGEGPFTVFAPTDAAFAKLPAGTVEALLADLPKLRQILKYHVVAGNVPAKKVVTKTAVGTLLGQKVKVDTRDGVKIQKANVTATDVKCSNGIIHVIDRVLLPADDVIDVARKAGKFKTLLAAVEKAGLTDALRGKGPITVFAPTDAAFAKLPKEAVEALLADKAALTKVLTYHVAPGKFPAKKLVKQSKVASLQGSPITVEHGECEETGKATVSVSGANVVAADVKAANGVIHVIDSVIMPPKTTAAN